MPTGEVLKELIFDVPRAIIREAFHQFIRLLKNSIEPITFLGPYILALIVVYELAWELKPNSDIKPLPVFTIPFWELSFYIAFILLLLRQIFRAQNKSERYASRELTYTQGRLSTLSRGKFHDIRNVYNKIGNLVDDEQYPILKNYVEKSAYYFSILLNNWDRKDWTLQEEIELLYAYLESEKALGVDVEIIKAFDDIDTKNTFFIPDVFTTFLQNSIEHRRENETLTLIISIKKIWHPDSSYLQIDVIDNAMPSPKENYFNNDIPNSGLLLLRNRLIDEFLIRKIKAERINYKRLKAYPLENGTQLTFNFPYEIAA